MVVEIAIIGAAVLAAIVVARSRPKTVRKWLEVIVAFRTAIFGGFLLVFALVLIFTGIGFLILLGAGLLFLIVLFVVTVLEGGDLRSATEVIRSWL